MPLIKNQLKVLPATMKETQRVRRSGISGTDLPKILTVK